jgi:hypothetical protein
MINLRKTAQCPCCRCPLPWAEDDNCRLCPNLSVGAY